MTSIEEMRGAVQQINSMVEESQGIIRAAQTKTEEAQGLALRTLSGSNSIHAQEVQAFLDTMQEDLNMVQRKYNAIIEAGNAYVASL